MKALLLSEYSKLQLVDLPVPEPAKDEIVVRVAACGICGSDVHGFDGSSGRRIPPLVMGHEAAGIVASVGHGGSLLFAHPEIQVLRLPVRYAQGCSG